MCGLKPWVFRFLLDFSVEDQCVIVIFLFLIVLASSATLIAETPIPDKALCSVCALKGGETELEKVKAHSEHDGKAYYFCSENCKKEFDSDPVAYFTTGISTTCTSLRR